MEKEVKSGDLRLDLLKPSAQYTHAQPSLNKS